MYFIVYMRREWGARARLYINATGYVYMRRFVEYAHNTFFLNGIGTHKRNKLTGIVNFALMCCCNSSRMKKKKIINTIYTSKGKGIYGCFLLVDVS